ncbi:hypothetical protein GP486_004595 [Trichoglossum hirsutum]|uniref:Peptidase C14 caspase domain-containing protein n=1 Tax=Trichoglossum hirsutum TaxID=265104 RepID=A0A9P8LB17_9PEZI|nr:hypothetical protein GP486_004595 [Trichoglossum hirsutum]
MSELASAITHWALLIGINFYGRPEISLRGCVRDVEHIEQYLRISLPCVEIQTLTATAPSDPNSSRPAEGPDSWPTRENVICGLRKITTAAKSGDFVYIHYSGHGCKIEGDLALALFDEKQEFYPFRGQHLAHQLKKMVDEGLSVTLVLDCCFSGSVVRSGDPPDAVAVRYIDHDSAVDAAYPVVLGTTGSRQVRSSVLRDAHVKPSWLVEPSGYTILAACGPHERAMELRSANGEIHGALSYFLMQALRLTSETEIPHEDLYHYLRIRFLVSWPQQNPMCYGNKDLTFFGMPRLGPGITFIPVFMMQGNSSVYLAAGSAHGVCKDDEYDVFPWLSEASSGNLAPVRVKVDAVRGLTSDLVGIDAAPIANQVETPSKARLCTRRAPRKVLVGIQGVDNELQWIAAAEQRNLSYLFAQSTQGQDCDFSVTCNELSEYEIIDEWGQKISSLPPIPASQEGALDYVLGLLEHLAAFRNMKEIRNRDAGTQLDGYTIQLCEIVGKTEKVFDKDEVDVGDKARVRLRVTNTSKEKKPIYLHIYNLGPSWQIDNLFDASGGGLCVVLSANDDVKHEGEDQFELEMSVPQSFIDRGDDQCEDILKVFITSQLTSFACLTLPKIAVSNKDAKEPIRGDYDQLSRARSDLAAFLRSDRRDIQDEKWATRNFTIHTKRSPTSVAGPADGML